MKVIAALRNQFGGHPVDAAEGQLAKGADAPGADVEPPVLHPGGREPAEG
jgi:6-phosphogluconate dehydrogenase